MKKWLFIIGIIVAALLGMWAWMSLSDSSTALMFSGAMKKKVESVEYAVPASGTNLRAYSWIDPSGMHCVGVYSSNSDSWGNCAFPPKP